MIIERVRYGSRGQGTLIKYADSPNWSSCYYVHGKEHRESTGTPDLKKARSWHKEKLDEIGADRRGLTQALTPASKRVKMAEMLEALEKDYRLRGIKSEASVLSHMKPIREHFGPWRAVDITAESVDSYIEARLEADKAVATVNRETQLLTQAFRLALKRKRITAIPSIRHLPERNARQGFFEADEFARMVAALPDDLHDFARFGYLTGWRSGEIKALRWDWVKGGVIRLPDSKNGRGRALPIDGELADLMKRRETERLLTTADGDVRVVDLVFHRDGRPIGDFRKAWGSACIKAGLYHVEEDLAGPPISVPEKLFHDLRRTAIRNMVRRGVPETVAMQISGHKTRAVFDRYNISSEADLRAAMQSAVLPQNTESTRRVAS